MTAPENHKNGEGAFTALVLAGQRPDDPLAKLSPQGQKFLCPVAGRPMVERVVAALMASGRVGRIAVSMNDPALLSEVPGFAELMERGRLQALPSAESPSRSVAAGLEALEGPHPLLVTTADHALLAPRMVRSFCDAAAAAGTDLAAALVAKPVILAEVPATKRTYLSFRDGHYSGANLFAFMTPEAQVAVRFWRQVEQERKRPWRIAKAFGWGLLIAYLLRLLTLEQAMKRAGERIGVAAQAVQLPYGEAAVDVDKPADLELAERLLGRRRGA